MNSKSTARTFNEISHADLPVRHLVLSGQETGRTSGLMRRLSHILSKLNTAVFLNQVFALIISKMFRFHFFYHSMEKMFSF